MNKILLKPAFVNSGYASDDNQVNIYVYYFNQNFNSIESIQTANILLMCSLKILK